MTPATHRLIGNILLALGIIVLVIALAGMSGLTPKLAPSRELVIVAMVLLIGARGFRRRSTPPRP